MRLLSWLAGRAVSESTPPRPAPKISNLKLVSAPEATIQDDAEMQVPEADGAVLLDEIYTIIDYVDAQGAETRRRLTLLKVQPGSNGPLLRAICHERGAIRTFRCDRIQCFIDAEDGTVTDTAEYFRNFLLIDMAAMDRGPSQPSKTAQKTTDPILVAARELRERLRSPLSILVLAARSDSEFHEEELDMICRWVEADTRDLVREGLTALPVIDALTPLIRKMNPTRECLGSHLNTVRYLSEERFQRLSAALTEVVLADGRLTIDETAFLQDLRDLRSERATELIVEMEAGWHS